MRPSPSERPTFHMKTKSKTALFQRDRQKRRGRRYLAKKEGEHPLKGAVPPANWPLQEEREAPGFKTEAVWKKKKASTEAYQRPGRKRGRNRPDSSLSLSSGKEKREKNCRCRNCSGRRSCFEVAEEAASRGETRKKDAVSRVGRGEKDASSSRQDCTREKTISSQNRKSTKGRGLLLSKKRAHLCPEEER